MKKRLPPAPTDSALARIVARIVPGASIARVRALEANIAALKQVRAELTADLRQMERDFSRIVSGPKPAPTVRYIARPSTFEQGTVHRVAVDFRSLDCNVCVLDRWADGQSLGAVTVHCLHDAARRIAAAHVPDHAEAIFVQTLAQAGFDRKGTPLK